MKRLLHLVLLLSLVPSGCAKPPPPPPVHYVVGEPYEAGGVWHYPLERFSYSDTGIAEIYPPGHPDWTTDGEAFDPDAMAIAHQTLQLPAVALLTNLETGRQVLVRVNDRGPESPARLVAVTPRVAHLLGFGPSGTARVRIDLDSAKSQALAQELHGGGALAIAAAPVGAVQATPLGPPGAQASPPPATPAMTDTAEKPGADLVAPPSVPLHLPETLTQVQPRPGTLWIECDSFTHYAYAEREQARLARLGAQVLRRGGGAGENDTVRIGPIGSVAEADAVLNQALRAGVGSARIIVEQE